MLTRSTALSVLIVLAPISASKAADLRGVIREPSPPSPPSSTVYDWSGGYFGVHAGMARGRSTAKEIQTSNDPTNPAYCAQPGDPDYSAGKFYCNINGPGPHYLTSPLTSFNSIGDKWSMKTKGTVAGVTVGFNKQKGNIVYGVEADVGFLGVRGKSEPSPASVDDTYLHTEATDYSTVRGRLGYAFDRLLVYGTAGAAMARFNSYVDDPDIRVGIMTQRTSTQFGFALGAGAEYALFDNVSLKADFMTMGFMGAKSIGAINITCSPNPSTGVITCPTQWKIDRAGWAGEGTAGWRISHTLNVARVGMNYKF
jgi:opacity protein-like surface antigen